MLRLDKVTHLSGPVRDCYETRCSGLAGSWPDFQVADRPDLHRLRLEDSMNKGSRRISVADGFFTARDE